MFHSTLELDLVNDKFEGVRSVEDAIKSVENNIKDASMLERVIFETCDVGDMMSVRSFAQKIQHKFPKVNLLINNGKIDIKYFSE